MLSTYRVRCAHRVTTGAVPVQFHGIHDNPAQEASAPVQHFKRTRFLQKACPLPLLASGHFCDLDKGPSVHVICLKVFPLDIHVRRTCNTHTLTARRMSKVAGGIRAHPARRWRGGRRYPGTWGSRASLSPCTVHLGPRGARTARFHTKSVDNSQTPEYEQPTRDENEQQSSAIMVRAW